GPHSADSPCDPESGRTGTADPAGTHGSASAGSRWHADRTARCPARRRHASAAERRSTGRRPRRAECRRAARPRLERAAHGRDGQLLRRIRRDRGGREIIIIDNSYRDPRAAGGFFVALPPPMIRIPYNRYIVDAEDAPPDLIYETMMAPPVERIDRRYTLDEIRYSPSVRQRMPSIDVNTINFETGSWEIP